MKNARPQTTEASALDKRNDTAQQNQSTFSGSDNPRHLRALQALETRPMPREHLDKAVGCSNSPELVAELRRRGLAIPCRRVEVLDRDGRLCKPGVYFFTDSDRRKLRRWLHERGGR